MLRVVLTCAVTLLAAGCGGNGGGSGIEAVDRPVSAGLARAFGPASGSQAACTDVGSGAMSDCHSAASARAQKTKPRLLAALPLSWPGLNGFEGLFVLYRTGAGTACFDVQVARRDGTGAGPLKCLGNVECGDICLTTVAKNGRSLVGGTVASDARELRLVYPGTTVSYRLDGPTAAALAGARIVLADVGTRGAPKREVLLR